MHDQYDIIKDAEVNSFSIMEASHQPIYYTQVSKPSLKCRLLHQCAQDKAVNNKSSLKKLYHCDKCKTVWFKFCSKLLK